MIRRLLARPTWLLVRPVARRPVVGDTATGILACPVDPSPRKLVAIYQRELHEFRQVLDTVPVVGRPPRGPDRDQTLRQLIELNPETARHFLADLEKRT